MEYGWPEYSEGKMSADYESYREWEATKETELCGAIESVLDGSSGIVEALPLPERKFLEPNLKKLRSIAGEYNKFSSSGTFGESEKIYGPDGEEAFAPIPDLVVLESLLCEAQICSEELHRAVETFYSSQKFRARPNVIYHFNRPLTRQAYWRAPRRSHVVSAVASRGGGDDGGGGGDDGPGQSDPAKPRRLTLGISPVYQNHRFSKGPLRVFRAGKFVMSKSLTLSHAGGAPPVGFRAQKKQTHDYLGGPACV